MRAFRRLLASSESIPAGVSSLLGSHSTPLLPPIPLYRRALRANRKLPKDMRVLGDMMVKAEFRAHRDTENPIHIVGFLAEWQNYVQKVEGEAWRGESFDKSKLEKMSDEQIVQLYELMQACKDYGEADGDGPINASDLATAKKP